MPSVVGTQGAHYGLPARAGFRCDRPEDCPSPTRGWGSPSPRPFAAPGRGGRRDDSRIRSAVPKTAEQGKVYRPHDSNTPAYTTPRQ